MELEFFTADNLFAMMMDKHLGYPVKKDSTTEIDQEIDRILKSDFDKEKIENELVIFSEKYIGDLDYIKLTIFLMVLEKLKIVGNEKITDSFLKFFKKIEKKEKFSDLDCVVIRYIITTNPKKIGLGRVRIATEKMLGNRQAIFAIDCLVKKTNTVKRLEELVEIINKLLKNPESGFNTSSLVSGCLVDLKKKWGVAKMQKAIVVWKKSLSNKEANDLQLLWNYYKKK